jgi:hypothetical protein
LWQWNGRVKYEYKSWNNTSEVGSSSRSEIGRWYRLISSELFMILKNKEKIWYILNINNLILFLSFVRTYWWNLFCNLTLWLWWS